MSRCEKYQELISRLIDEELDEQERAVLAEHLESCKECALLYSAFSQLSNCLSSELEEVPAALHENTMAELRRNHIAKQSRRKRPMPAKKYMAAAACLALFILASVGAVPLLGAHSDKAADMAAPAEAAPYFAAESQDAGFGYAADTAGEEEIAETQISNRTTVQNEPSAQAAEAIEEAPTEKDTAPRPVNCTWEELSAFLSGELCDIEFSGLPEPVITLCAGEENEQLHVMIYDYKGKIYYRTALDETVYSTQRSQTEIEAFLAEQG